MTGRRARSYRATNSRGVMSRMCTRGRRSWSPLVLRKAGMQASCERGSWVRLQATRCGTARASVPAPQKPRLPPLPVASRDAYFAPHAPFDLPELSFALLRPLRSREAEQLAAREALANPTDPSG